MITEYSETIGHGCGHPTGLEHFEKMDVIACLLDEGERTYVNDEHTAWISSDRCAVGEMVTLDDSSTMEHTVVRKAKAGELAFGYLLGKVQVKTSGLTLVTVAVLGYVFRLKLKRPAPKEILPNTRIYIDSDGECNPVEGHDLRLLSIVNIDLLGTTQADGGLLVGDKEYIGFDLRNSPLIVLYSKSTGTTTAPITSDDNIADFYSIIEIMRKDIYDELP